MVRITDGPDMTLAVYRGRKAINQTNISVMSEKNLRIGQRKQC